MSQPKINTDINLLVVSAYTADVFAEIVNELERATEKFPTWPTDALHAFAIVNEEVGELQKELLQFTYEPHKSTRESIREEAIQLAAMAARFLISLDRYEYQQSSQHSQSSTQH
jgi:NTP pyrophosphatase (non-canonical NTP hydrolase)